MGACNGGGMMTMTPTLLTVILNYRTPELTLRAAEAALRAMIGIKGQITIVDNDSGDGSFETIHSAATARGWLQEGRVQVLQSGRNGGFGAGNNFGIKAGLANGETPDFIYVLNSDAFPRPGAIKALIAHLDAHPRDGMAGSYIEGEDGAPHSTAFRFPSIAGEFEGAACTGVISRLLKASCVSLPLPHATQKVDWLAGASLMIRREVLDQIGLFDETFFLYFEETDLCNRARKAGWATTYVRDSEVTHIGSVSTGMQDWARTPRYWFDSRRIYFVKTQGRAYAALATLAHVTGALIYRLRSLLTGKPRLDPPHFLRDLIAHALWLPARRSAAGNPETPPNPLTEQRST